MKQLIGVYGAGNFGLKVMPLVRLQHPDLDEDCFVFIDDSLSGIHAESENLPFYRILTYKEFLAQPAMDKKVTIAISDSEIRELLAEKLTKDSIANISIRASSATSAEDVELGEGSILCDHVTLTPGTKVGKFFNAKTESYVAQNCTIGDYVTLASRVICNANVHIHDHAYIGTNVIIEAGTPDKPLIIGKGAVIGKNSIITKDVPADSVVAQSSQNQVQAKVPHKQTSVKL